MAVYIDSTGDTLNQTSSLPANTAFTVMGDGCIAVNRGDTFFQIIAFCSNASFTDGIALVWNEQAVNPKMCLSVYDASATVSQFIFRDRPDVGRPFCWYVKCSGTGTNLVEGGWRYPNTEWVIGNATLGATVAAPTQFIYGQTASTYYARQRHQNIKTWSRALGAAEIQRESESDAPVIRNGLHSWCPLISATNVTDLSGNARNMTTGGTLDTHPLYFPRTPRRPNLIVAEAPAAGTTFQILAGRKFSLAGMAGLAGD